MKTLEQLNEEILRVRPIAEQDVNELNPAIRGAWSVKINEAKTELQGLLNQYKQTLLNNGIAIFLKGDAETCWHLAKLAFAAGESLYADAGALYGRLADAVEPTFSEKRVWSTAQYHRLLWALREEMESIGLPELEPPKQEEVVVSNRDACVEYVRRIVRAACGDSLNRQLIEKRVLDDALKIRYIGLTNPVMIMNATDEEMTGLGASFAKGRATAEVKSTDEINKDYLTKLFKETAKKIRKK